ncbi:innate immunity activator protein [Spea bombifrons]|uniref:innate immunity activator protein n=1 Tax=Spea bombifrons TaxID=233779 RepID=UPI0023492602|nr:innate immunity activator protein [Spea bombifrons]
MGKQEALNEGETHYIVPPGHEALSPGCRELTQAVRIQQRSLEQKMQSCLDELRRLCLREAELTGVLPKEYPLKTGETPPKVRRRVGALFKLDERAIQYKREDPLSSLEADILLQRQITEAARRLYLEDSLSKQVRHRRKVALRAAEQKLLTLEDRLIQERSQGGGMRLEDSSVSESSSMSDITTLEDDDSQRVSFSVLPSVTRPLPPQTLEGLRPVWSEGENEKNPLQNSPWRESSLDLPYEKPPKGLNNSRSQSSSPAVTPLPSPQELPTGNRNHNTQNIDIITLTIQGSPESSNRSRVSKSVRIQSNHELGEPRGRSLCRRATSFNTSSNSVYSSSLSNPLYNSSNPLYTSSSDTLFESPSLPPSYKLAFCPVAPQREVLKIVHVPSIREHVVLAEPSKPDITQELHYWHIRASMRGSNGLRPRSLDRQGAIKLRSGTSWSHLVQTQKTQVSHRHVLRRTAEGAPLQWYDPEEAQIISQV